MCQPCDGLATCQAVPRSRSMSDMIGSSSPRPTLSTVYRLVGLTCSLKVRLFSKCSVKSHLMSIVISSRGTVFSHCVSGSHCRDTVPSVGEMQVVV